MSGRRPVATLVLGSCLFICCVASATQPRAADDSSDPVVEPQPDIRRVWIRVPKRGSMKKHANRSGALFIDDDQLRVVTRKVEVALRFASMRSVSYGRMRGDVDTEWTVIEVEDERGRQLFGIRDGSKMGFGHRSPEIHERLIRAIRSRRAAQYDVAAGQRSYDAFDWQFTAAVPEAWSARLGSLVYVGGRAPWGSILFVSPGADASEITPRPGDPDERLIERIRDAEIAAVTLERRQAMRGANCEGLSSSAREAVLLHLAGSALGDPAFAAPSEIEVAPREIDGCQALRVVAEPSGRPTVEIWVVAQRDVLYMIGARAGSESGVVFDGLLSSFRFAKGL